MQQIINALILAFFCHSALAQEVVKSGSFSEKDLPKVAVTDAPVKSLEINKSTLVTGEKGSIASLLLNDSKVTSLMFDDEENGNIERALDAFRSNQQYVPEETEEERIANSKKRGEDEQKAQEKEAENAKSFVYLASIIYFGAKDWAVWVNDQKITFASNNPEKEIFLTSVKNNSVKLTWKISLSKWKILSNQRPDAPLPEVNAENQVEINFELQPNQTYSLKTGKVSEGRAIIALLKPKISATPAAEKPTSAPAQDQSASQSPQSN